MRFMLLVMLSVSFHAIGQDLDLSSYLSNVVDIGGGNFGLITAESKEGIVSFVTVIEKDEQIYSGISVKFYLENEPQLGHLVETFPLENYTLALYECRKPTNLHWRTDHYDAFGGSQGPFKSFLDNGKSDNLWYTYREPISIVHSAPKTVALMMNDQSLYHRGMPIFNNKGSIVGLVASNSNGEEVIFEAIDFSVIEESLYKLAKCKYFQLIRYGDLSTLCAKEEKEKLDQEKKLTRFQRLNRAYGFTMAPAISPGILLIPSNNPESDYAGFGFTTGINFYINPDKRTRFSFKPRYGQFRVALSDSVDPALILPGFKGLKIEFYEIPLMLEFVTNYNKRNNYVWAIGYVPSLLHSTELIYVQNNETIFRSFHSDFFLAHKLLTEITFENKTSRWGFFYALQLNRWLETDFSISAQQKSVQPFEGQKALYHYFGVEFSWRLWGSWLLKEKL